MGLLAFGTEPGLNWEPLMPGSTHFGHPTELLAQFYTDAKRTSIRTDVQKVLAEPFLGRWHERTAGRRPRGHQALPAALESSGSLTFQVDLSTAPAGLPII